MQKKKVTWQLVNSIESSKGQTCSYLQGHTSIERQNEKDEKRIQSNLTYETSRCRCLVKIIDFERTDNIKRFE